MRSKPGSDTSRGHLKFIVCAAAADDRPKRRPWRSHGVEAVSCARHFRPHNENCILDAIERLNIVQQKPERPHSFAGKMRDYTLKEKAKITAGAVAALVIVVWLAIIALALLSGG